MEAVRTERKLLPVCDSVSDGGGIGCATTTAGSMCCGDSMLGSSTCESCRKLNVPCTDDTMS